MGRIPTAPITKEVTFSFVETKKTAKVDLAPYQDYQNLRNDVATAVGVPKQRVYFSHKNKIIQDYEQLRQTVTTENVIDVSLVKTKVPGPPILPLVGSLMDLLPDIDGNWYRLIQKHGSMIKFGLLGDVIHMTDDPLVLEMIMLDADYFTKNLAGPLLQLRPLGRKGLFTADTKDPEWQLGHKLLMPAFSPKAMRGYTSVIAEVASKLCRVFDEFIDQGKNVDPLRWMTNVTFEAIAKVGFGYSFGVVDSAKGPTSHPFLDAMASTLNEVKIRVSRPELMSYLPLPSNKKFTKDIQTMHDIVKEVITSKKRNKAGKDNEQDLLDYMLTAKDEYGNSMNEDLLIDQVITFLIAGHETTANTLCWAMYLLACNPDVLEKCREEIESIQFGADDMPVTAAQVSQLVLVERVIKETLRLYPPVGMTVKVCKKECVLPSGHELKPGEMIAPHFYSLHRNETYWSNPEAFDPDRWLPENESKRPTYSWLPFSIGARACIGRQFAMLEAKLVLAMVLRNFHYTIPKMESVKRDLTAITTKPTPFVLHLSRRKPAKYNHIDSGDRTISRKSGSELFAQESYVSLTTTTASPKLGKLALDQKANARHASIPVTILYGSNTGTAMDYAHSLATTIDDLGFKPIVAPLDEWHALTRESYVPPNHASLEMVFIVTATYNGLPPENARKFDSYLSRIQADVISNSGRDKAPFKKIQYAVFGCGNSDWVATYQTFPTKIDDFFESLGASRFVQKGAADAKLFSTQEMFDKWMAFVWEQLSVTYQITVSTVPFTANGVETDAAHVSMVNLQDVPPGQNTREPLNCTILESEELHDTSKSGRSTKMLRIEIPDDYTFVPGDHFELLPQQTEDRVEKVAKLLRWNLDDVFKVGKIPSKTSVRAMISVIKGKTSIRSALTYFADLTGPVTKAFLKIAGDAISSLNEDGAKIGKDLIELSSPDSAAYAEFVKLHRTLVDFLEAFPIVCKNISLADFLCGVNVITPRRYSIANSPCSFSKGQKYVELVVGLDIFEGPKGKKYQGLASSFLCCSPPLTQLAGTIKASPESFRLPKEPSTPIIMISAGTGLAPFLGFLEDRAATRKDDSKTALIFGCRDTYDHILSSKLSKYATDGVLAYYKVGYSRSSTQPKEYVQDIVVKDGDTLWELIDKHGAVTYICGSSAMSKGVSAAFEKVFSDHGVNSTVYLNTLRSSGRYNEDVWG